MADQKAKFVPGTKIIEAISQCEFVYGEAHVAFKPGDEAVSDGWGVMHPLPEHVKVGVLIAPAYAFENIPKGQFGLFITQGCTAAHKEAKIVRVQKKAEEALGVKQEQGQQKQKIQLPKDLRNPDA